MAGRSWLGFGLGLGLGFGFGFGFGLGIGSGLVGFGLGIGSRLDSGEVLVVKGEGERVRRWTLEAG